MAQAQQLEAAGQASTRWMPWVLAAIAVFVLSFELGSRELSSPDEARYAAISWSMLKTGDWLTPTHNLKFYHWHKPPVTYWLMASSFAVLGRNEWAARLPSACAAFAVVMGVYIVARTLHGRTTGFYSGLILLASPLFFALARVANTDMLVCAFITWTWVCFVRCLFGETRRRAWFVLGGLFAGLGFMTKGPVLLMSTLVPMVVYLTVTRQWRRIGVWPWLAAAGVFLVVGLPWYIIVAARHPGLLTYFIEYQTLQRLTTEVHHRTAPFWFFGWVVPLGFAPWIVLAGFGVWGCFRRGFVEAGRARHAAVLPIVWAAVVLAIISLSKSKLITYCLPMFPALALLAGWFVVEMKRRVDLTWGVATPVFWTALVVVVGGLVLAVFGPSLVDPDRHWLTRRILAAMGWTVGSAAAAAIVGLHRRPRHMTWFDISFLVVGGLYFLVHTASGVVGHEDAAGIGNASNELAALIEEREERDAGKYRDGVVPVMYRRYLWALPYYLGRPVLCLDCDIEFDYARPNGTTVSFYADAELKALEEGYYRWNGKARLADMMMRHKGWRLLVVTDRESYEDIRASFVEDGQPAVYLVAAVGEFVICSNHPDVPRVDGGLSAE